MSLEKYISVEPSLCQSEWRVWFDLASAMDDGAIRKRPLYGSPRTVAFHIEEIGGSFAVDDDNDSEFDTFDEAVQFAAEQTSLLHDDKGPRTGHLRAGELP